MAQAKKLPSGSWRCRASYMGSDGKKHFKSFTASTQIEAEYMAAEFRMNRRHLSVQDNWPLGYAIDQYIELKRPVLSPTTISSYEKIRKSAFQDIMNLPIGSIDSNTLQKAVNAEMLRRPQGRRAATVSPKTIHNEYGLVASTLRRYCPDRVYRVDLPKKVRRIRSLPLPEEIYDAVKDTDIELHVLLAMWLSFTESEIRGLTKSKSIDGNYITIREVLVIVDGVEIRKEAAKEETRNRRHRIPGRIKQLIDEVDGDVICPMSRSTLIKKFKRYTRQAGLIDMTFHDLRHINATLMATLRIPDKYAQERGGWKTDHVMKSVYMETFSEERKRVDDIVDEYFEEFV